MLNVMSADLVQDAKVNKKALYARFDPHTGAAVPVYMKAWVKSIERSVTLGRQYKTGWMSKTIDYEKRSMYIMRQALYAESSLAGQADAESISASIDAVVAGIHTKTKMKQITEDFGDYADLGEYE